MDRNTSCADSARGVQLFFAMSPEQRAPWRTGDPHDRLAALRRMVHPTVFSSTNPLANVAILIAAVTFLLLLAATDR